MLHAIFWFTVLTEHANRSQNFATQLDCVWSFCNAVTWHGLVHWHYPVSVAYVSVIDHSEFLYFCMCFILNMMVRHLHHCLCIFYYYILSRSRWTIKFPFIVTHYHRDRTFFNTWMKGVFLRGGWIHGEVLAPGQ